MLENVPDQQNSTPDKNDPAQAALQWMQQQLAEQGVTVSPEEALELFKQKIAYDIKRGIQQELAEQGIDVSPEEAVAIDWLQLLHRPMKYTDTTDPHDAIERMVSDDSPRPYEPNE